VRLIAEGIDFFVELFLDIPRLRNDVVANLIELAFGTVLRIILFRCCTGLGLIPLQRPLRCPRSPSRRL
jgi:hypothetical protein